MKISIISPNLSGCCSILDIGVTCLATFINERTKHQANILDYTFKKKRWKGYLKNRLDEFKPDVIGITTTSLFMNYVRMTIEEIRNDYSQTVPIVLGGYHATLSPDSAIQENGVDAIIHGEGEYILADYLDALEENKSLDNITGLWHRKNGQIFKNSKRPWIEDIDSLPIPNYDLWEDIEKYFYFVGQLWLMGTRGCPFKCTNCSEEPMNRALPGRRFRVRDPRSYVAEIKHQWSKYKDRGLRMAHPFDAVFTANAKWVSEFCDEYKRQGLSEKLPFSVFTHGATSQEDKVRNLAEAGCKEVRIGIESGNERVRNEIYGKKATNSQLRDAFHNFHKYGMVVIAYNMLGGPTETKEILWETYKFNKELDPNKPIFFIFRPLPGTDIISMIESLGEEIDVAAMSHDIDTLHWGAALKSKKRSENYVEYFQLRCFSYFVSKRIWRLIKKQKIRFFINLVKYMHMGWKYNLDMRIVFAYFLASCGDNLFM
ncbi:B12-binding domain-containing radical SAM protein [Candidatus Omnitrophota bacterium]